MCQAVRVSCSQVQKISSNEFFYERVGNLSFWALHMSKNSAYLIGIRRLDIVQKWHLQLLGYISAVSLRWNSKSIMVESFLVFLVLPARFLRDGLWKHLHFVLFCPEPQLALPLTVFLYYNLLHVFLFALPLSMLLYESQAFHIIVFVYFCFVSFYSYYLSIPWKFFPIIFGLLDYFMFYIFLFLPSYVKLHHSPMAFKMNFMFRRV